MKNKLTVHVYDDSISSPVFVRTVIPTGLKCSTKLPGGFGDCSFTVPANLLEAWKWMKYGFYQVKVLGEGDFTCFEGRIEEPGISAEGATVTAYGFYANCFDTPYDDIISWNNGIPHYADEIIKDMLTTSCPQISSNQQFIQTPDTNLEPVEFGDHEYPGGLIEKLASYSDSQYRQWFFAIWEDRIPHFFPQPAASAGITWHVRLADLVPGSQGWKFNRSYREVVKNVYVTYSQDDWKETSTVATDSTYPYSVVRTKYISAGESTLAKANTMAQQEMETYKRARQNTSLVLHTVRTKDGGTMPPYMVRAGHSIRIDDLFPDEDPDTFDGFKTFYIRETSYDAESGQLTINPDTPGSKLERMLARGVLELA